MAWVLEEKGIWWEHKYHWNNHVGKSHHRCLVELHSRHLQQAQKNIWTSLNHPSNQAHTYLHCNCAEIRNTLNHCYYLKNLATCRTCTYENIDCIHLNNECNLISVLVYEIPFPGLTVIYFLLRFALIIQYWSFFQTNQPGFFQHNTAKQQSE